MTEPEKSSKPSSAAASATPTAAVAFGRPDCLDALAGHRHGAALAAAVILPGGTIALTAAGCEVRAWQGTGAASGASAASSARLQSEGWRPAGAVHVAAAAIITHIAVLELPELASGAASGAGAAVPSARHAVAVASAIPGGQGNVMIWEVRESTSPSLSLSSVDHAATAGSGVTATAAAQASAFARPLASFDLPFYRPTALLALPAAGHGRLLVAGWVRAFTGASLSLDAWVLSPVLPRSEGGMLPLRIPPLLPSAFTGRPPVFTEVDGALVLSGVPASAALQQSSRRFSGMKTAHMQQPVPAHAAAEAHDERFLTLCWDAREEVLRRHVEGPAAPAASSSGSTAAAAGSSGSSAALEAPPPPPARRVLPLPPSLVLRCASVALAVQLPNGCIATASGRAGAVDAPRGALPIASFAPAGAGAGSGHTGADGGDSGDAGSAAAAGSAGASASGQRIRAAALVSWAKSLFKGRAAAARGGKAAAAAKTASTSAAAAAASTAPGSAAAKAAADAAPTPSSATAGSASEAAPAAEAEEEPAREVSAYDTICVWPARFGLDAIAFAAAAAATAAAASASAASSALSLPAVPSVVEPLAIVRGGLGGTVDAGVCMLRSTRGVVLGSGTETAIAASTGAALHRPAASNFLVLIGASGHIVAIDAANPALSGASLTKADSSVASGSMEAPFADYELGVPRFAHAQLAGSGLLVTVCGSDTAGTEQPAHSLCAWQLVVAGTAGDPSALATAAPTLQRRPVGAPLRLWPGLASLLADCSWAPLDDPAKLLARCINPAHRAGLLIATQHAAAADAAATAATGTQLLAWGGQQAFLVDARLADASLDSDASCVATPPSKSAFVLSSSLRTHAHPALAVAELSGGRIAVAGGDVLTILDAVSFARIASLQLSSTGGHGRPSGTAATASAAAAGSPAPASVISAAVEKLRDQPQHALAPCSITLLPTAVAAGLPPTSAAVARSAFCLAVSTGAGVVVISGCDSSAARGVASKRAAGKGRGTVAFESAFEVPLEDEAAAAGSSSAEASHGSASPAFATPVATPEGSQELALAASSGSGSAPGSPESSSGDGCRMSTPHSDSGGAGSSRRCKPLSLLLHSLGEWLPSSAAAGATTAAASLRPQAQAIAALLDGRLFVGGDHADVQSWLWQPPGLQGGGRARLGGGLSTASRATLLGGALASPSRAAQQPASPTGSAPPPAVAGSSRKLFASAEPAASAAPAATSTAATGTDSTSAAASSAHTSAASASRSSLPAPFSSFASLSMSGVDKSAASSAGTSAGAAGSSAGSAGSGSPPPAAGSPGAARRDAADSALAAAAALQPGPPADASLAVAATEAAAALSPVTYSRGTAIGPGWLRGTMLGASGRAARRIRALIALPQVSLSCGSDGSSGGGPGDALGGAALAGGSLIMSRIVTGAADGTVRVYVAATGAREAKLAAHKGAVRALAAFHDGLHFASGGEDGVVQVWTVGSGSHGAAPAPPAAIGAGDASAARVASTSSGSANAADTGAGAALADGHAPVATLQPGGPSGPGAARGGVNAMVVLRSGLLAVAYGDSSIALWRLHTGSGAAGAAAGAASTSSASTSAGSASSGSSAGGGIAAPSGGHGEVAQRLRLRVADITGGAPAWGSAAPMGLGAIVSLAALSDGRLLAGTDAGCVCVWETAA